MQLTKRFAYRSFRLTSSLKYRLLRRFTPSGLFVLAVLFGSALLGIDTKRTLTHQAFTFLASLALISMACALFFRGTFSIRRKLPRYATAGESLSYGIVAGNRTAKAQNGLKVMENLADPRPTFEEFLQAKEPGEEKRNLFDRNVSYFRWEWLITGKQSASIREQALPDIPPNGEVETKMELNPLRRGVVRLTSTSIVRMDPFGLVRSFFTQPDEETLLVLPKRYALPPIQIPGSRKYHQGGVALASEVGDSEEFVALRDYIPGDPMRRIHWKSWARTGKPVVKEYQEEYFARHALILDTFMKEGSSELFEEAVSVAASFASGLESKDTLLDLMFAGEEAYCFTSGRSLAHTDEMLEVLASVKICPHKPFDMLRNQVTSRASLLSGCICVFLSWDEERISLIRQLQALGIFLLVLVVTESTSPSEQPTVPMEGRPENFYVLEMGKIAEGLAGISV